MKQRGEPLVSVIVPIYNVEQFLNKCLDSITQQTYKNLEIILVDDKTPDNSGKIANEYAKSDKRVRAIHKKQNRGLNRARQTGFEHSRGDYITFVDSDDILQDNFIARLLEMIEKESADIAVSGYQFFTNEDDLKHSPHQKSYGTYNRYDSIYYMLTYITYWPYKNSPLNNVIIKLFRRSIVEKIDWDFCDYNIGEDDFMSAEFINLSSKNVVTDEQLYYYRFFNPGSLTADRKAVFKYCGKPISAFELCNDYLTKASKLFGEDFSNEVNYRAYILYKYYVWNLIEHKFSLSVADIKVFDKLFPTKKFLSINKHPLDMPFLQAVDEGGLMNYVEKKIQLLVQDRDSLYERVKLLQDEHNKMMSIKGSLKRFGGNMLRRVRRDFSKIKRRLLYPLQMRPTINQDKVDKQILHQLKHVYDNQTTNIPKVVHYCWMGKNVKSQEVKEYIKTWKKYLPDYEFVEWNENNFNLNYNYYVKEAYQNKKWAFVSDVVRLHALYYYGGIYMDVDVEVLKPLEQFLDHHAFSSFEAGDPNNPEPSIPTGLMASERKGLWAKELLEYYRYRFFVMPDGSFDMTPNPVPITDHTIEKYHLICNNKFQDLGAVTIYPSEYFCPKSWKTGKIHLTKNSYAIHHFQGSWLPENEAKKS
ncbi:glycosyltransferase [Candidatus Saccharibacteria bacterium]|nr:glycosyltransferase [Candidatus Saccharibacteria bacterium]